MTYRYRRVLIWRIKTTEITNLSDNHGAHAVTDSWNGKDCSQAAKKMISKLLEDGNVHTIEEMTLLALEKQIIEDKNDNAVKNALYQMKKDSSIINLKKGMYQMNAEKKDYIEEKDVFEESISNVIMEVKKLKQFNWIHCTNEELTEARNKILQLSKIYEEIKGLIK